MLKVTQEKIERLTCMLQKCSEKDLLHLWWSYIGVSLISRKNCLSSSLERTSKMVTTNKLELIHSAKSHNNKISYMARKTVINNLNV